MMKFGAFVCLFVSTLLVSAQTAEKCGTDKMLHDFFLNDPDAAQKFAQNRNTIRDYLSSEAAERADRNIIITIPVVFHIIHSGQSAGVGLNITDAQVYSQIDVLNECYRLRNADTAAIPSWFQGRQADIQVEFCLAGFDPSGNATTGITRHNIPNTANFDDNIKPTTQWDPSKYLNIWTTNLGNTILGYATIPGLFPVNQDGVVLDFRHVGAAPANPNASAHDKGRTCVHEVGHWLNLLHVFEDSCMGLSPQTCSFQGDYICDTPPEKEATYGQPNLLQNTCHESPVDENDMWMNYMDYADDDQMHLFTHDQRDAMRATLNTYRSSIQASMGCTNAFNIFFYSGHIVDAATNAPVANARVLFDGQQDFEVVTDANGLFAISNLTDGYYDVYAGKWGYSSTLFAAHTAFSSGSASITIPIENHHYYDDFTFDFNWTKTSTATGGIWVRDMPAGTFYSSEQANPGEDSQDDFTDRCFVTGNGGGAASNDDVDNGTTTLISPSFDLSGFTDPYIRYQRWFYDGSQSANTPDDNLVVKLNNGSSTVTIETISGATGGTNKWLTSSFRISDYITPTGSMRLIIDAGDAGSGNPNIVEAGIDKFEVKEGLFASVANSARDFITARIYPNPATGIVNLQYALSRPDEVNVKVLNILGQPVYTSWLTAANGSNSYSIDLSSQPGGIYYITLQTEHSEKTLKFSLLR